MASERFDIAVTCSTAIFIGARAVHIASVGTVFEEQDNTWFEVVGKDGTYQVIVQDAKAKGDLS